MHQHCSNYARSRPAVAGDGLPAIEAGMPAPAGTGLSRRSLMLRSLGLGVAASGAGAIGGADAVEAAINDALAEHKVVVSVFFDGGWDSLSVLAPFGTDHKHEARAAQLRPGLSGSGSIDRAQAQVFSADPSLSWHPAASGLKDLWDDPNVGVAVAPACGYPNANGSHFTSRHFWEVGALDVGGTTGWMGRYLDIVGRSDVPIQGITMGGSLSPAQATDKVPVSAIYNVDDYNFWYPGAWDNEATKSTIVGSATKTLRALGRTGTADAQLATSRMVTEASFQLVDDLAKIKTTPAPAAGLYGANPTGIARQLRDVARLLDTRINGGALPIRCVSVEAQGGFDTHSDQTAEFGTNLKANCDAIKAFWQDLRNRGEDDRVVMLVWSEFGRRPEENGSGGCDHGAAGAAFVLGKNVRQGLVGEFPGLKAAGS
ncbi:MAG: DUF1501 domain-containing protein, partial [Solirubrobacteraceae bacterium]|nr:DUF1501 domain-containing protein [Solirubrobacteraceae bacterium]